MYHSRELQAPGMRGTNISNNVIFEESSYISLRKISVGGELKNVTIRLSKTCERIQAASDLVNNRYAWRGYGSNHRIPVDPSHITFTAEIGDEVVGTITLAVDSVSGLAVDKCFHGEIDEFRALPGVRVCELTKFAFGAAVRSKELMAALFHIVFVYGHRTFGSTDLFIEVNPRHVRFYETTLGFQRVGALKINDSVSAPAQLMRLEVAAIRDHINQAAGSAHQSNARSLYPFFFSPAEESGIYCRLARAGRQADKRSPEAGIEKQVAGGTTDCWPRPSLLERLLQSGAGQNRPRRLVAQNETPPAG